MRSDSSFNIQLSWLWKIHCFTIYMFYFIEFCCSFTSTWCKDWCINFEKIIVTHPVVCCIDDCISDALNSPLWLTSQIEVPVIKKKFWVVFFLPKWIIFRISIHFQISDLELEELFLWMLRNNSRHAERWFDIERLNYIKFFFTDKLWLRHTLDKSTTITQFDESNFSTCTSLWNPSSQSYLLSYWFVR